MSTHWRRLQADLEEFFNNPANAGQDFFLSETELLYVRIHEEELYDDWLLELVCRPGPFYDAWDLRLRTL